MKYDDIDLFQLQTAYNRSSALSAPTAALT